MLPAFSSKWIYGKQLYCFSGFILGGLTQLVSSSICHKTDFSVLMRFEVFYLKSSCFDRKFLLTHFQGQFN